MVPVSNVDQLVAVLRRRLLERPRPGDRTERKNGPESGGAEVDPLHALAKIDGIDDRQLGRALIHGILADQFGTKLINEAKFQQVVDRVVETLEADPATAPLLASILAELKAQAR